MATASRLVTMSVPQTTVTVAPKVPTPLLLLHKPVVLETTGLFKFTETMNWALLWAAIPVAPQALSNKPSTSDAVALNVSLLRATNFDRMVVLKRNRSRVTARNARFTNWVATRAAQINT